MKRHRIGILLVICAAVFAAAIWGSINCGNRLAYAEAEEATHLRRLIYFHFALAQLAVAMAVVALYHRHRRWRKYYLLVSYNAKGLQLNPPGIRMPAGRVYRCHLGNLSTAELPPPDAPILVYPMFMLSGYSSGAKLESALAAAYNARHQQPDLYYQPVLGASPWLAKAAAAHIRPLLQADDGILVVAHGSGLAEPPPEPALFCRRLRELLPGIEICLGYFNQTPEAQECLCRMQARRVLVLPFLLTEGLHTGRDLPTAADAARYGKHLLRLPIIAQLLTTPPTHHA